MSSPTQDMSGRRRRFLWRARQRVGSRWWLMSQKEIDAYLRSVSWRRAL